MEEVGNIILCRGRKLTHTIFLSSKRLIIYLKTKKTLKIENRA